MTDDVDWTYHHVAAVNMAPLNALAERIAASELTAPNWRMPMYPDDDIRFVQFIGVQNAINAHFTDPVTLTKYTVTRDGIPWSGSTGLCAALMRSAELGYDLCDPHNLQTLDLERAETLLAGDDVPLPLLPERVAYLNSVGATLQHFGHSFLNVAADAGFDAPTLVENLVEHFAAYATDRWVHPSSKELMVFDKRARLFTLMYEGRARDSKVLRRLSNIDEVGPVIDYQLPRLLRAEGVLVYAPTLSEPIDNRHLLPAGSEAELALRSVTGFAVELIAERVNRLRDDGITMVELDYALWSTGRGAPGEHHLTATLAY